MTQIANYKNQPNQGVTYVCVVCEQLLNEDDEFRDDTIHEYTSEPCPQCQAELEEGNYIFVLISDKSEENKINRLGRTWVVEGEEVEKAFDDLEQFEGEQVVFIRESEALDVGLLEERVSTNPEEESGNDSEIIMPDDI